MTPADQLVAAVIIEGVCCLLAGLVVGAGAGLLVVGHVATRAGLLGQLLEAGLDPATWREKSR